MKSFLDMMGYEPIPNSILLVDALNFSFRYKHLGKFDFALDFVSTTKSLAKSYKSDRIIITADQGSSTSRRELYPEYKGNRKVLQEKQTEEEKDNFLAFLEGYEAMLIECAKHWPVLRYKGVEADDIAGYVCKNIDKYGIDKVWLISSDKDWDLLVNDRVSRFSFITRKEITAEGWPYDVERENFLLYKCLMGDSGDNIIGIAGIGEKRASTLANEYKTVDNCIASVRGIKTKSKYMTNLKEGSEILKLNKILMDLLDEDHIKECLCIQGHSAKSDIDNIMGNLWQK